MANICDFSMMVKGEKENIEQFIDMMQQKGTVWMGRGAVIHSQDMEETELCEIYRCQIDGETKWSIQSSMVSNAISMRTEPDKWEFGDTDKTTLTFVTLFEACEQLQLDMEVYSEECGCGFQEHYVFVDGNLVAEECVDYTEEYNEETEEYESSGGFDSWDFEI